jgi:DnaJ-domain-containing protein 1
LQLNQHGLDVNEGLTISDPDLLEFVMETREEVEHAEDKDELKTLRDKIHKQQVTSLDNVTAAFESARLDKAAEAVMVLRYLTRIQDAILEKL